MKYAAIAALLSATASSVDTALDAVCADATVCGTTNRCAALTATGDGTQASACVIPANCVAATAGTITIATKAYTVTANTCKGNILK
jgi:hypothetical protein